MPPEDRECQPEEAKRRERFDWHAEEAKRRKRFDWHGFSKDCGKFFRWLIEWFWWA
jgi:hypothetical protein